MKAIAHITLVVLLVAVHPLLPRSCGEACAAARPSTPANTDIQAVADEGASCCGPSCCCNPEQTKKDVLALQLAPCTGKSGETTNEDSSAILVARAGASIAPVAKPTHSGIAAPESQPEFATTSARSDFGQPPPSTHLYEILCTLLI